MVSKLLVGLVLGCALLGGYTSIFTSYRYGYLDALRICTTDSPLPGEKCVLDMSDSIVKNLTGFPAVDEVINVLLEFFSQGLRVNPDIKSRGIDLEALLAFVYLATQFGGAWYLIALEGLRVGNKDTVLSWTGTFGIVFQSVTITIIAPLYLTLQLLSSPSSVQPGALLVHPRNLAVLPLSAIVAYILPSIGLCLPLLNMLSGEPRWLAIALWQPFPLYHSVIQGLTDTFSGGTGPINLQQCRKALNRANRTITILAVLVHWAVMGTILASVYTDLVAPVDGHHILALTSLEKPPIMAMLNPPVSVLDSREIVVAFLRWDVYCTCASMLLWSAYQLHKVPGAPGAVFISIKAVLYALIGGPIFPSLMFVWERDEGALGTLELLNREPKSRSRTKA